MEISRLHVERGCGLAMKTEDREFLLEVYRQVLEHQREADRKRDRLISIYVPSGSLLWFLIQLRFLQIPQLDRSSFLWVSIGWLVISGIVFYILHFLSPLAC